MSSTKYPTPLASPTETYLLKRGERFHEQAAPSMLVRLSKVPEKVLELPRDLALSLIRRRAASVVGTLDTAPDLVLSEDDVDELEASGFSLFQTTEAITQ